MFRSALGQCNALQIGVDLPGDRRGDAAAQLFFQAEQIGQRRVVALAPDLVAGRGFDQLHGDANLLGRPANTAFNQVVDAKFRRNFTQAFDLLLESKTGVARFYNETREQVQMQDNAFRDTVAEILLLGVAGQVVERQHGDVMRCFCIWFRRVTEKFFEPRLHQAIDQVLTVL